MAQIRKIVRVANPRKRVARRRVRLPRNAKGRFLKRSAVRRKANSGRRRVKRSAKRSTPVIRRYSVKAIKKELRRRGVKANPTHPRRRRRTRVNARRRTHKRSNPVLIELGALNPRKRSNRVARRRRKANPTRRRTRSVARRVYRRRRRANPVAVVHHRRRRRAVGVHHRRRRRVNRHHYRRNPALFGRSGGKDLMTMVGGGLIGVAAAKYIPTLLPASLTASMGGSPIMGVVISGAGAFAAGMLAKKFLGEPFGDAVLFGGLMQTGSMLLTAIAPASLSSSLALSGLGDIGPGYFVVPQNPITNRAPVFTMPAPATPGGGGMGAFRRAFGGQR